MSALFVQSSFFQEAISLDKISYLTFYCQLSFIVQLSSFAIVDALCLSSFASSGQSTVFILIGVVIASGVGVSGLRAGGVRAG